MDDITKYRRKVEELEKRENYLFIELAKHTKDIEQIRELIQLYMVPFLSLSGITIEDEEFPVKKTGKKRKLRTANEFTSKKDKERLKKARKAAVIKKKK